MKLLTLILFVFIFTVYSLGVSASVFGGDSGDIILASWFGGVAHPPGYPINTMVGWVFTHLPYQASVAFKANLMAGFLMAVTISILFLIIEKLTKKIFVALACSLTLAFNPLFLLYAHVIEVFQLNLVLVGLSVLFLFTWREARKDLFLVLAFLFLGLSIFHHHTSVLIVPAYTYLIFSTDKKIIRNRKLLIKLFGSFVLGFLPYVFIPFAALRQTPINWDDPSNFTNFLKLISRADYGAFVASNQLVGDTLTARVSQLRGFFLFVKSDFSVFGTLLVLLGASHTFLKEKKIFYFVLLAIVFTGPFFLFYASFPVINDFYLGLWERFVLLPYFFLAIYMGYGFLALLQFAERFFTLTIKNTFLKKGSRSVLIGGVLLLFPFYFYFLNITKADLSDFKIGDWLGYDILISAEPNSIILTFADTPTFNSQYIFYTQNNTNKIKLVLGGQLRHLEYRKQIMRSYPDLKFAEGFMDPDERDSSRYITSLVISNIDSFSVYSTDYSPAVNEYKWMKVGLLKKLLKSDEYSVDKLVSMNEAIYAKFKYNDFSQSVGYSQFMTGHIQATYYRSLIEVSDELIINGEEDVAILYLNSAVNLAPDAFDSYIRLGSIAFKNNRCEEARDNFVKAYSIDNKNWLIAQELGSVYKDCFKNDTDAQRYFDDVAKLKSRLEKPL